MASSHTSLSRLLTPLLSTFRSSIQTLKPTTTSAIMPCRTFSSTPTPLAAGGGPPSRRPGGKGKGPPKDARIKLIRYHMQHPKTPRPLKLSRMRALRHWTIHRAWMLAQRKRVEGEESELMRYVMLCLNIHFRPYNITSYHFQVMDVWWRDKANEWNLRMKLRMRANCELGCTKVCTPLAKS